MHIRMRADVCICMRAPLYACTVAYGRPSFLSMWVCKRVHVRVQMRVQVRVQLCAHPCRQTCMHVGKGGMRAWMWAWAGKRADRRGRRHEEEHGGAWALEHVGRLSACERGLLYAVGVWTWHRLVGGSTAWRREGFAATPYVREVERPRRPASAIVIIVTCSQQRRQRGRRWWQLRRRQEWRRQRQLLRWQHRQCHCCRHCRHGRHDQLDDIFL